MPKSSFRLPYFASALVLGSAACGDPGDGKDATRGVDTSDARIRAVARDVCEADQRCNADFSESYTGLDDCTEERVDSFLLSGQSGEHVRKCQDAVLDLAVCYSDAECTTDDAPRDDCLELYATYEDLCEDVDTSTEEPFESKLSPSRSGHLLRQFRIPH